MENTLILKIIGSLLILSGIVLASYPELVSNKPVPEDVFKAVERRIWWGLLIGVGMLLMFHYQLKPWGATISATLSCLLIGLLIARFIGIALDGSVMKQWVNVGIELVILAPLLYWFYKVRV